MEKDIGKALDRIEDLIDPLDAHQVRLYNSLRQNPSAPDHNAKLDELLIEIIVSQHESNPKAYSSRHASKQLIQHLQAHTDFLRTISIDPEMASLFLIGQSGKASFTKPQKAMIEEQINRTQQYLDSMATFKQHVDYTQYFSQLSSLPEKLRQVHQITEQCENETDPVTLKMFASQACSIAETVTVFNDVLIRQKSFSMSTASRTKTVEIDNSREIDDLRRQKDSLKSTIEDLKTHIKVDSEAQSMVNDLKDSLRKISQENREMRERLSKTDAAYRDLKAQLSGQYGDLSSNLEDSQKQNAEMIKTINQLESQIKTEQQLLQQKDKKIAKLGKQLDDKSDQFSSIQSSVDSLQIELDDLRSLYNSTTGQLQQIRKENAELKRGQAQTEKSLKRANKENDELHVLLSQATEENRSHNEEKTILLKQLRRQNSSSSAFEAKQQSPEEPGLKAKYERLKKKLLKALALIDKLHQQIHDFRQRESSANSDIEDNVSVGSFVDSPRTQHSKHLYHGYESKYRPNQFGDCGSLKPYLDDLDSEIHRLDTKVKKSHHAICSSSSSSMISD